MIKSHSKKLRRRVKSVALVILLGLALAGFVKLWEGSRKQENLAVLAQQSMHPVTARMTGTFMLSDYTGKTVRDTDFGGKYRLVYFGYTYCPDECPTGLSNIAHALDQLGDAAKKIAPIFISIDPARDTPKKLHDYVTGFHPDIISLTGDEAATTATTKSYQVYVKRVEGEDGDEYEFDHSTLIYLMGPDGKFIRSFPDDVAPTDLAKAIQDAMKVK